MYEEYVYLCTGGYANPYPRSQEQAIIMGLHWWICRGGHAISFPDPETGEMTGRSGIRYHCATCWMVIDSMSPGTDYGLGPIVNAALNYFWVDQAVPDKRGCPYELYDSRFSFEPPGPWNNHKEYVRAG